MHATRLDAIYGRDGGLDGDQNPTAIVFPGAPGQQAGHFLIGTCGMSLDPQRRVR